MDSCSSSPSHPFKDRPRSHHSDLSRQASSPHALEREKSPAEKRVSESREACVGARDHTRRSYGACSVENNGCDGVLSGHDRGRNSLRRPFGFERQRDSKTEMHRSVKSYSISRNSERESGETAGRLDYKRNSSGEFANRQEILEGLSSPLQNERESSACRAASQKGYDKEGGDGKRIRLASPEVDKERKSPVSGKGIIRNDSKEALKGHPKRSVGPQSSRKDMASDKDCALNFPLKKEAAERGNISPARKAFSSEVLDDGDAASTKKKPVKSRDLEKPKEQKFASNEAEPRAWNKDLLCMPPEDILEDEQLHESKSPHEDDCSENPVSFLHVSKRARSDRDRGTRDEHAGESTVRYSQGNEFAKAESQKASSVKVLGHDSPVKKGIADGKEVNVLHEAKENEESSARSVEVGVVHANERSFENLEKECRPPINGSNSDMEEGELEPEIDTMIAPGFAGESTASAKKGEEIKGETYSVFRKEPNKEPREGQFKEGTREKGKLMVNGDEEGRHGDDDNKNSDAQGNISPLPDKEEPQSRPLEIDSINIHKNLQMSTSSVLELVESSRAGVLVDLLGAKCEVTLPSSIDIKIEPSKQFTLSLLTNLNQKTAGGSSQAKGDRYHEGSHGKFIVQPQSSDAGGGEGSSQLFRHKQKKLKLESLQLSLAPPGSSNIVGAPDSLPFATLAEPSRSFQSLNQTQTGTHNFLQSQTNSDGFTSSFSFSQSESFIHNPSCSLKCTSFENQEISSGGTRQLSQGAEHISNQSLRALSANEHGMHMVTSVSHDKSQHRHGLPLYQRVFQNGSMHQGFPSVTGSNKSSGSNHFSQKSYHHGQQLQKSPKILDSSSQDLDGSLRRAKTHKDIIERARQQKAWFASRQQVMSTDPHWLPAAVKDRDKHEDFPIANLKGMMATEKDIVVGERTFLSEKIGLHEITMDPIAIMAQKLQELPDSFLEGLKSVARRALSSFEKREDFLALQENVRRRKDLTEDYLLRAHRTQLEILVALKTGCQSFIQEGSKPQTYKVLIEIFLETRCRNLACQQSLPVYECGCRVCSRKSGYCCECMCVVCFKFDSDDRTCRWLGCDVCLHWCHTDCALRMSYIVSTSTDKNTSGTTEIQYHCVACDHKLELYGFVKDVFQNCAENWGAETLAKELDCVRKIFHGSDDMRGRQLLRKAEQMLQKLENKVDVAEVCRSMLQYINGHSELDGACKHIKGPSLNPNPDILARISQLAGENIPTAPASAIITLEQNAEETRTEAAELQHDRACKRAEIEDMEREIRMKQAEATMFQVRADEVRQEAGGLERIISLKKEKFDEEYAGKYAKLRLSEAEERHQKRFEDLKAVENAQQDFQKMKVRMEAEIKELMLKMEIAKRQFT